ncbi:DMT family transporter [Nocardia sp. NPDC088792]|uniref:DMT family transporter n=1 Tax=Nocardia sp. NPDC088792 TaxID=3364332 RepID=UPI0038224C28
MDGALLVVAMTWGSSYLAARKVATTETVFGFLALRFGLAVAMLALLLAPRLRRFTRRELACGVAFGLILSGILVLETFGVTQTSASNAGLIISLTIVITPLLDSLIRKTVLPRAFHGAAAMAVVGVLLLTENAGLSRPGMGDVLILLAALTRAVHVTVISHVSHGKEVDSGRVTLVQLATVLVISTALATVNGAGLGRTARDLSGTGWLLTAYLALACTVFAFFIQMWAVRRTSPARVSLLLGTEPLWAAFCGVLVGGDHLTLVGSVGGLLVLTGTNWGRTIDNRPPRHDDNPPSTYRETSERPR